MSERPVLRPRAYLGVALGFLAIGVAMGLALSGSLHWSPTTLAQSENTTMPAVSSHPLESPFADVVARAVPAVVLIETKHTVSRQPPGSDEDPFDLFRRMFPEGRRPRMPETLPSSGSGFLIDPSGRILTNNHVVRDAREITVTLLDKRSFHAKVVGQDQATDVAIIQINSSGNFPVLPLGDSDAIRIGDWAIAIGNPLGELQGTVTAGIVSAKGRSSLNIMGGGPDYQDFIQTDASINFGNSGGPLMNIRGEVIGINTAINASGQGIGFAIPINLARHIADQLVSHGKVVRGYMGVQPGELTPDLAESFGLKSTEGVVISQVVDGSPAARAGLKEGDIVVAFDGRRVKDVTDFRLKVADASVDKRVRVDVLRNGQPRTFVVTLANRDVSLASQQRGGESESGQPGESSTQDLGLRVRTMTEQERSEIGHTGVIVQDVASGSQAEDRNIEAGDVVLEVNGQAVHDRSEFTAALRAAQRSRRPARLLVGKVGDDGRLFTSYVALRTVPE